MEHNMYGSQIHSHWNKSNSMQLSSRNMSRKTSLVTQLQHSIWVPGSPSIFSQRDCHIYSAHEECCPLISPFKRNNPCSCSPLSFSLEYLLYLKGPWKTKIESERGLFLPVLKSCESCFPKSFIKFSQNSAHSFNFRDAVKVTTNNDTHLQFEKLIYPEMCDIFTYVSFPFHLQRATELWRWTIKLESFQFHSILKMQMRQVLKSATQLLFADFNLRNSTLTRIPTETEDLLKNSISIY